MAHGIISTLSVAALGLLAARASDLFRIPLSRRNSCDEKSNGGGAWTFDGEAAQQKGAWLKVGREGTC